MLSLRTCCRSALLLSNSKQNSTPLNWWNTNLPSSNMNPPSRDHCCTHELQEKGFLTRVTCRESWKMNLSCKAQFLWFPSSGGKMEPVASKKSWGVQTTMSICRDNLLNTTRFMVTDQERIPSCLHYSLRYWDLWLQRGGWCLTSQFQVHNSYLTSTADSELLCDYEFGWALA